MDTRSEKIGYKIREAQQAEGSVHGGCRTERGRRRDLSQSEAVLAGDEGTKSLDAFIADIQKEIEAKVNRVKEVSEEK